MMNIILYHRNLTNVQICAVIITYGTAKYWWIYAARNPDILIDPIRDFSAGRTIKIPSEDNISNMV